MAIEKLVSTRRFKRHDYVTQDGNVIPDMHPEDVQVVADEIERLTPRICLLTKSAAIVLRDAVAHGLATWRACREQRAIAEARESRIENIRARVHAQYGDGEEERGSRLS